MPLLLTFIAIFNRKNKHVIIFTIIGLFALFFSFGKYSIIFPSFYEYFPFFDTFRAPARFLYVYAFSISILAGLGLELLIIILHKPNVMFLNTMKIIFLFGLIFLPVILFLNFKGLDVSFYEKLILNNSYAVGLNHKLLYEYLTKDILLAASFLICFSIIILLKIKNRINLNFVKIIIVSIIILDLWIFNFKIISTKKITEVYDTPQFINKINKDKEIFRVFDKEGYYLPLLERNKIENVTGIHSLYIKDYQRFLLSIGAHKNKPYESFFEIEKINFPIFLNLLNTKYVLSNTEIMNDSLKKISKHSNVHINYLQKVEKKLFVYQNKNLLPRAYIVPNAIVLSKNNVLDKLKSKNFDPKNEVILQKNPNMRLNNSSFYKEVKISYRDPNKIQLNTTLENPGFLVLSEVFYPGWKAYDNNKETEIYKANYILRSIYLDKGTHRITFIYSPDSYKTGAIISISAVFLICIYLLRNKDSLVDFKSLFS